jgi:predicted xylose isomerase-like sugar epimerase
LLGEAKAAIERGNPQRALELLHTYDKSFHHGVLAEERMATGVLYLCAVGRIDDAKIKARQFIDRYPRSPLLIRIEGSCAGKVNALR